MGEENIIDRLTGLAEKATPGSWVTRQDEIYTLVIADDEWNTPSTYTQIAEIAQDDNSSDAEFIAACDPPTILKLLKVVELANQSDCYNDCGNGPGRATCEDPRCRALADLGLVGS